MKSIIRTAVISLALAGPLSALAQPLHFDHGSGHMSVHPMPFGDAVSRVVIDLEMPSGSVLNFDALVTLRRVSVTAYGAGGFVSLTEQGGRLVEEGGTLPVDAFDYWSPELSTWVGKSAGSLATQLRSACGACSSGNAGACQACGQSVVAAFVAPRRCAADYSGLGDGSGNDNDTGGGTGESDTSYNPLGDGSGNDNDTGGGTGEAIVVADPQYCSVTTLGDGSGNDNDTGGGTSGG